MPILPERLEAARNAIGLSVNALADKAAVRQQTVDAMRRAPKEGRRCREAIRDRLAKALDLPEFESNGSRWLGGEVPSLLASVKLFDKAGRGEFRYQWSGPAAVSLARLKFIERCRAAWERDHARPAETTVPPRPRTIPQNARFFLFQIALEHLTTCVWWRDELLRGPMYPPTRAEYEAELRTLPEAHRRALEADGERERSRPLIWDEMTQEEREDYLKWWAWPSPPGYTETQADRIELGLIQALDTLFEPWFNGEAEIEFEKVMALATRRPKEAPHA